MKKLVRDKIPEIIIKKWGMTATYIADNTEYSSRLREKLKEELLEFLESDEAEELADMMEVMYSICEDKWITMEDVEDIRKIKKEEKWWFEKKIIMTINTQK